MNLHRSLSLLLMASLSCSVSSFLPPAFYSRMTGTGTGTGTVTATTKCKAKVSERRTGRQGKRDISPSSSLATTLFSTLDNEDESTSTSSSTPSRSLSNDDQANGGVNDLTIEYCTGCRWLLRSAWLMQELFTTFHSTDEIRSITLVPSKPPSPGGTFVIQLNRQIIWDRKRDGGFPESKVLKQIVRNVIAPMKSLGHSDSPPTTSAQAFSPLLSPPGPKSEGVKTEENAVSDNDDCEECNENGENQSKGNNDTQIGRKVDADVNKSIDVDDSDISQTIGDGSLPNVKITYCTGCRWMLRSAWICQELLTTFEEDLHSVTLVPSALSSGIFNISIDGKMIWDRKHDGGFPEIKVLKQRVRDTIAPARDLGHIDHGGSLEKNNDEFDNDELDDDSAAELRNFYGVL